MSLGLLYALIIRLVHINIPCVIHAVTGLRCPGCGITHAMMALFHGEFAQSLRYNYFLPVILGYCGITYLHCVRQYVKTGKYKLSCGNLVLDAIFLAMFCGWAVVRNILDV